MDLISFALIVVSPAFLLTFLCLIFTDYKMLAIIFLFYIYHFTVDWHIWLYVDG